MRAGGTTRPSSSRVTIRVARTGDALAIAAIRNSSPEAAQWEESGYDTTVAEIEGAVVGFLVTRTISDREAEILNIAVERTHRRQGIAKALVRTFVANICGEVFLEVRESNQAARAAYKSMDFQEVGIRKGYYGEPPENGVVMKFHSC